MSECGVSPVTVRCACKMLVHAHTSRERVVVCRRDEESQGKRLERGREAETLWASGQRSCIHNHTVVSLIDIGRERQREEVEGEESGNDRGHKRGGGALAKEEKIPSSLVTE